jgi:hypothetical protein
MTEAKYTEAYKKACSAQPNSRISSTVQAVYEAHRFNVKRLEHIIQKLVLKPSAEGDVLLRHYRNQQNVTHMMSTTTVEEFYVLAISQSDSASPIFCRHWFPCKAVIVVSKLLLIVSWQIF